MDRPSVTAGSVAGPSGRWCDGPAQAQMLQPPTHRAWRREGRMASSRLVALAAATEAAPSAAPSQGSNKLADLQIHPIVDAQVSSMRGQLGGDPEILGMPAPAPPRSAMHPLAPIMSPLLFGGPFAWASPGYAHAGFGTCCLPQHLLPVMQLCSPRSHAGAHPGRPRLERARLRVCRLRRATEAAVHWLLARPQELAAHRVQQAP